MSHKKDKTFNKSFKTAKMTIKNIIFIQSGDLKIYSYQLELLTTCFQNTQQILKDLNLLHFPPFY